MRFYEIEFLSIPKVLFALNAEVENYQNSFVNRKEYLEISLIESAKFTRETLTEPKKYYFRSLFPYFCRTQIAQLILLEMKFKSIPPLLFPQNTIVRFITVYPGASLMI